MPWFKALLTYPQLAGDEPQALRKKFSDIWVDSGSPKEMALFCETDPTDEGLSVYFSPALYRWQNHLSPLIPALLVGNQKKN